MKKEQRKEWYNLNKEKESIRKKKWYSLNRDKILFKYKIKSKIKKLLLNEIKIIEEELLQEGKLI